MESSALPPVGDLLGRSVIYEEYKGDYARARRAAEDELSAARRQEDPVVLADALLARGLVHLLQGEFAAALTCFEEMDRVGADDPARRIQAILCGKLATYQRYLATPDGGGTSSVEVGARWDGLAYAQAQERRRAEFLSLISDPDALPKPVPEYHVPEYRVAADLVTLRSLPSGLRLPPPTDGPDPLDTALQAYRELRRRAEAEGVVPGLLAQADLVAASLYRARGEGERAREFLAQASDIYSRAGDRAGVGVCHMTRGDWLAAPYSAPEVWNQAMREDGKLGFLPGAGPPGPPGPGREDLAAARAAYAQAGELFLAAGAPRGLAALRLRDGYLAAVEGDYGRAGEHAGEARRTFEEAGDCLGAWVARAHQALSGVGVGGRPDDSATGRAVGAWGREGGSFSFALGLGFLFLQVGWRWLLAQGDFERALACCRLAEDVFRALGATHTLAICLEGQGRAWELLGEHSAALAAHENAWGLHTEVLQTQPALAAAAWARAVLLGSDITGAHLSREDPVGMEGAAARLQALLGHPLAPAGPEGKEAEVRDTLRQHAADEIAMVGVMAPLQRARSAQRAGEGEEAQRQFGLAVAAARRAGPDRRDFLEATVLGYWERYPEAAEAFQRHLAFQRSGQGIEGRMADFFRWGGMEEYFTALRRQTHLEQAAAFFTRVKAYSTAKTYWDALEEMKGPEWWLGQERPWRALANRGETYEGLGQLGQAQASYDRAIALLEARRDLLRRDEWKTAFDDEGGAPAVYFLAAQTAFGLREEALRLGDNAQAVAHTARVFDYAERGKARALLDLMAAGAALGRATRSESQAMSAWRRLNARLAAHRGLLARARGEPTPAPGQVAYLNQQVAADEAELGRAEAELAATNPEFYQAISPRAQVLSLDAAAASLPPDTALLQYYFRSDDLLVWALTRRQGVVHMHRARLDVRALNRDIRAFHRACEGRGPCAELGAQLAEALLGPVAAALEANPHLLVVPHGAAHLLPFHALPWAGRPLVVTHTLSYLPSASALQFLAPAGAGVLPDRLLAVGNPADMAFRPPAGGDPVPLPPLPAAEVEAAVVAGLFPQGKALLGGQASVPEVLPRLGEYPLLHFATHGHLSEEAPLLSSILLAGGEGLSLYELMGQRLQADLVVLSACDTGRGQATGGDDVLGLTRGLLGTGARAAVVSLWSVNDLSTSLLMSAFYHRLRDGPAVALQAAQNYLRGLSPDAIREELAQLKGRLEAGGDRALGRHFERPRHARPAALPETADYSHASYWAPFIFIGRPPAVADSSSGPAPSRVRPALSH
jgi:CHAT domain-containing protein